MKNRQFITQAYRLISLIGAGFATVCLALDQFALQVNLPFWVKSIAIISLIIGTISGIIAIVLSSSDGGEKTLPYEGKRYTNFFVKWYIKEGNLTLCCNDLDWLEGNNYGIFEALALKARQRRKDSNPTLVIWLSASEVDKPFAKALKELGAEIKSLPLGAVDSAMTFSIREYNGHKSSILRYKEANPDAITVHINNSDAYTALLEKLCESFERQSK